MKKIIIAFVYHDFRIGGAEKEILAYMQSLNKHRYDIHLCLTYANGEMLSAVPTHVHIHEVSGNSYTLNATHIFNLYRTLKNINPDIVVGALQEINLNLMTVKLLSRLRYKAIITEHIILSEWQNHIHTHWLKKLIVRLMYNRADLCIVQTAPIYNDLKRHLGIPDHKLYIVPNYLTWPSAAILKERTELPQSYIPFILFVGRITPQKNIAVLLHAYSRIVRTHKRGYPKLLIIGPHKHSHLGRLLSKLRIQKDVIFLGYKKNPWMYYMRAFATVIPSKIEGRCRAMVEAMMMKCPVISSNFTGHADYITHKKDGLVFNKTSVEHLTSILSYAITHPTELKRIGMTGYKRVSAAYNKRFYDTYSWVFESAIQKVLSGER